MILDKNFNIQIQIIGVLLILTVLYGCKGCNETDTRLSSLENQTYGLNSSISTINSRLNDIDNQLRSINSMQNEIQLIKQQNQELSNRINSFNNSIQNQIQGINKSIALIDNNIKLLRINDSLLGVRNWSNKLKIDTLRQNLDIAKSDLNKKIYESDFKFRRQFDTLNKTVNTNYLTTDLKINQTNKTLSTQLSGLTSSLEITNQSLNFSKNEIVHVKENIFTIEKKVENLQDKYYTPSFYVLICFILLLFIPIFWYLLIKLLQYLADSKDFNKYFPRVAEKIKSFNKNLNKKDMNEQYVDISANRRLDKLNQVVRLFVIPTVLLFLVLFVDFLFNAFGLNKISELEGVKKTFDLLFQYIFPLILLSFVLVTFYSSYRILQSKDHKNLVVFFLIQILAYFIFVQVGIGEFSNFSKIVSVFLTFVIAAVVVFLLYIPSHIVKINEEMVKQNEVPLDSDELINETSSNIGLVVSAIFSLIIAAMIYFRIANGINFISWGILIGIFISIIVIKGDKTILGLFYFLDPNGAIYLFHLHKLKGVKEKASFMQDIQREEGDNIKDIYIAKLTKLSNTLLKLKNKSQYEHFESMISAQIVRLKDPNLSYKERMDLSETTDNMIAAIMDKNKDIAKITHAIESSRPLREKITEFVGLTEDEQNEAIHLGFISQSQQYIWNKEIQSKIKKGSDDFDNKNINKQADPIIFANSVLYDYPYNSKFITELIDELNSNKLTTELLIGSDYGLEIYHYKTINRDYIVIAKNNGTNVLIHCIHEIRNKK